MPPGLKTCNICQKQDQNLRDSEEVADDDDVKFITKLTSCVPELDWTKGPYLLCQDCAHKLDLVYDFRKLCLRSFERARNETGNGNCDDPISSHANEFSDGHHQDDDDDGEEKRGKNIEIQTSLCNSLLNKKFKTNRLRNVNRKSPPSEGCDLRDRIEVDDAKPTTENISELTCFNCDRSFQDKDSLIAHFSEVHPQRVDRGEADATSEKKLKSKRGRKPSEKQIFQCTVCRAIFSTKYLLSRHVRNVHATEKRHNCDICGQKFASPVYLSAHKRYHSGERPHICSSCGKGFITASDLYHHEKIHANKRSYKCDKCPKAFNTSSDLHKHNICVHMDRSEWKYVCAFCDKRFPLKTNMDTHVKIHTGEKNFPCHLCERRFINKSVLLRHVETHSNVRSFRCAVCGQEYKYQKSLNVHMTKAHGIGNAKIPERSKKFICHICPKAYYANNKLQKHIRTHTGERPFACGVCEKKFIDRPCLNQHMKSAHSILFGILNN